MSNCEYVGRLVKRDDGRVVIEKPRIPPRPDDPRRKRKIWVPESIDTIVDRKDAILTYTVGNSMQPTILDGDTLVIDKSKPATDGSVVAVRFPGQSFPKSGLDTMIARCRSIAGSLMLVKDNVHDYPQFQEPVERVEFLGEVVGILPREFRDVGENHDRIQRDLASLRSFGDSNPARLVTGVYGERTTRLLELALRIPRHELDAEGRLPWGMFRAFSREDHPLLGIRAGGLLIVKPTPESCAGDLIFQDDGRGGLQLGRLQTDRRGSFWLAGDSGRKIADSTHRCVARIHAIGDAEHAAAVLDLERVLVAREMRGRQSSKVPPMRKRYVLPAAASPRP